MTGIPEDCYETQSRGGGVFNVFHLPGHFPELIALYEKSTGMLFAGDTVYDGALFDTVYHSDRAIYRESLKRLRELPVSVVYSGQAIGDVSNWIEAHG